MKTMRACLWRLDPHVHIATAKGHVAVGLRLDFRRQFILNHTLRSWRQPRQAAERYTQIGPVWITTSQG